MSVEIFAYQGVMSLIEYELYKVRGKKRMMIIINVLHYTISVNYFRYILSLPIVYFISTYLYDFRHRFSRPLLCSCRSNSLRNQMAANVNKCDGKSSLYETNRVITENE